MRILNVDYMGCLYWHYHAQEPNPTWNFLKRLREIIDQFKVDKTLLLLEGGSNYRLSLHPGYKAKRKELKEAATPAEKRRHDAFRSQANSFTKNLAPLFGLTPVRVKGAEADDLAGYLCNHIDTTNHQILNLSGDQDWYQLLRKNVVQGSYSEIQKVRDGQIPNSIWLSESGFRAKYDIPVSNWIWKKCLSGDSGDSVAGFEGLGDGTALALLQKYGSIEEIGVNRGDLSVPRMKQQAKDSVAANFPLVYDNYKVMNLNHDAEADQAIFGTEGLDCLNTVIANLDQPNKVQTEQVIELSYEHGWLEVDQEWLRPFARN